MSHDQIIRGAAHYNRIEAEAWRAFAQQLSDVLVDAADALGAAMPIDDTTMTRHLQALANVNTALATSKARGL
jgi:hypothetical protein